MQRVESILSFWFGPFGADGFPLEDRNKLWFYANADTDTQIRQCFGPDLQKAGNGQLAPWQYTPRARLALIILLDQFSRNIYRGTPRAFAQDPAASALALAGIHAQHDLALGPCERAFFYMPLEHSEDLAHQDRCLELYNKLISSLPAASADKLLSFRDHAVGHRDIIAKFGRFPHRNKILGRPATPPEIEFLSRNPSRFGQG
ncbi:MAG: DUF924 family protein [Acidiferrobacterales bacterium]